MRISINGEITLDKLANALNAARAEYQKAAPGFFIYGATLNLDIYDFDGVKIELIDDGNLDESYQLTIDADDGELQIPPASRDGLHRIMREKSAKAKIISRFQEEREIKRAHGLALRKRAEDHIRNIQLEETKNKRAFDLINNRSLRLAEIMGREYALHLNHIVDSVWSEMKPVEPYGPNRGELKGKPIFDFSDGVLTINTPSLKNPRVLKNPLYSLSNEGLKPLWTNLAWDEVARRILILLDDLEVQNSLV